MREIFIPHMKPYYNTMHVSLFTCLAIPPERAISKIDLQPKPLDKRLPYRRDLLALTDGIRRHERHLCVLLVRWSLGGGGCGRSQFRRLPIPTGDIIDLSGCLVWLALLVSIKVKDIGYQDYTD